MPFSRWHPAISQRRSRRQYEPGLIEPDALNHLAAVCKGFKPFPEVRAELVNQSPDQVFKGAVGHYGKIKNAPSFIAFIGNANSPFINELVGYAGEGIVLEATALNLATCWVGGFFRPETAAELAGASEKEIVLAVTPVGYAKKSLTFEEKVMGGFGRHSKRKPLTALATGLEKAKWPEWMRLALEAARLAPSAVNRQPWRFYLEEESITVSTDNLKRHLQYIKTAGLWHSNAAH